jgi:hypothetical protein
MQLTSSPDISPADLPSNKEASFLLLLKIDPFISSAWEKTICEIHLPIEASPSPRDDTHK